MNNQQDHRESEVDALEIISECLNPDSLRSFFLYAGAGSGKTYTLVGAMKKFRHQHGERFTRQGKKVAVITYTNAARDEIRERINDDSLFVVSTIHSFCWRLIQGFDEEIRGWVCGKLRQDIEDLQEKQLKGRAGRAADIRGAKIERNSARLNYLKEPKRFTYSATGSNSGKDSLNHAEVIAITSAFLMEKEAMRRILTSTHPVLLIDESQDTKEDLIDALLEVESHAGATFALGLIGDTMQRIYGGGKADLGVDLPSGWAAPTRTINRRCPRRIVELGNTIRREVATDGHVQTALDDAPAGVVRLFIADSNCRDKAGLEDVVRQRMAEISGDDNWRKIEEVKCLTLEHRLASERLGFEAMFESIGSAGSSRSSFLDGSNPICEFFSANILPLHEANEQGDEFGMVNHLRNKRSPLLDAAYIAAQSNKRDLLPGVSDAVKGLLKLIGSGCTFHDCLRYVHKTGLFAVVDGLRPYAQMDTIDDLEEDEDDDPVANFLKTPFSQIAAYRDYVGGNAPFDTHQGVKGREFPRVQVVMDDASAKGFLFSYDKMFGVKEPTAADLKSQEEGKETGVDRTRRLFYVVCTRAEEGLALVAYTADKEGLKDAMLSREWFAENELILL